MDFIVLGDGFAEGEEGEAHELEVLHSEGYSHYCDAEDNAPEKMSESNGDTTQKPPDDVHNPCETTGRPAVVVDVCSERPKCHHCQFQSLESERDANDGDHHCYA